MFYFVYRTTNLKNGNIYVGVHQTEDLDDGYLGSGMLISQAIHKHGRENFKREILKTFSTNEEAYLYESEIVNQDFIERQDVYNLSIGGNGASILLNRKPFTGKHSEETKRKLSEISRKYRHTEESKLLMSLNHFVRKDPETQRLHAINAAKASHSEMAKKRPHKNAKTGESLKRFFAEHGSAILGIKRELVTCPNCKKQGANNTMSRWHFDKCRTMVSMV